MSVRDIKRKKKELAKAIRDFSRNQKKLWQLIPNLALEADGRTGYQDNFSRAYHYGAWAIRSSKGPLGYMIYVDLATGELVDSWRFHQKKELIPARVEDIIVIDLEELDAQKLIQELKEQTHKGHSRYMAKSAKETAEWRAGVRRNVGLKEVFAPAQRGPVPALSYFD